MREVAKKKKRRSREGYTFMIGFFYFNNVVYIHQENTIRKTRTKIEKNHDFLSFLDSKNIYNNDRIKISGECLL